MDVSKFFAIVFFVLAMIASGTVSSPQFTGGQRGRAISGSNRINEAEEADYDDYDSKPRKYGRRGYRSRCRCAKISNCPKLQITIPRCPPEEFVCCFN